MARHAELLERRLVNGTTTLYCRIYDDDPAIGELGRVLIADGTPTTVRQALVAEAQRLQTLAVGRVIDL